MKEAAKENATYLAHSLPMLRQRFFRRALRTPRPKRASWTSTGTSGTGEKPPNGMAMAEGGNHRRNFAKEALIMPVRRNKHMNYSGECNSDETFVTQRLDGQTEDREGYEFDLIRWKSPYKSTSE